MASSCPMFTLLGFGKYSLSNSLGTDANYNANTLHIPARYWGEFTPFEKQYWEIKSQHWDTVVFFKKGKFYELYEKDADIGHREFDLKLTDRVNMKMVGVPEKTFATWASKFIALGYKVARVDEAETQIEKNMREKHAKALDKSAKKDKIITRELKMVLTAGTLTGDLVVDDAAAYIMSVKEDPHTGEYGVVFLDASTAQFNLTRFTYDAYTPCLPPHPPHVRCPRSMPPSSHVLGLMPHSMRASSPASRMMPTPHVPLLTRTADCHRDDASRTLFETLIVQVRPLELVLEKVWLRWESFSPPSYTTPSITWPCTERRIGAHAAHHPQLPD